MPVRIRRLIPLRPGPAANRRLARLLGRLAALAPTSARTRPLRAEGEHLLMRLLATGGLRAVERALSAIVGPDLPLQVVDRQPALRRWTGLVPPHGAELAIAVTANRLIRTSRISWQAPPAARTRPRGVEQLQGEFYSRYLAAGQRAYANPPRSLSRADRLILRIGEFEADVNNGGFRQFLDNKGRRRAGQVLQDLGSIGARRTAALLDTALRPDRSDASWQRLDRQYDRLAEDLALLTMRHLRTPDRVPG